MIGTELTSRGLTLEDDSSKLGELLDSTDLLDDPGALKKRLDEDGYLFLPRFLERDAIAAARYDVVKELAKRGDIDDRFDIMESKAKEGFELDTMPYKTMPSLTRENANVLALLTDSPLPGLFEGMLGGTPRYFERILLRVRQPSADSGTHPHCDSVFMNRGTKNLFTTWIPLGDVPYRVGGLIVLEKSHHLEKLRHEYSDLDVDEYCTNHPDAAKWVSGEKRQEHYQSKENPMIWNGRLSDDPVAIREQLGGRWLSAEYSMGDVLIFSIYTVHGSLDNRSDEVRISVDTRWQLASEPADPRWVGPNPPGHSDDQLRGKIC